MAGKRTVWRVHTLPRADGVEFNLALILPTRDPAAVAAVEEAARNAGMTLSRMPRKGHRFGKLLVTSVIQPAGASFADDAYSTDLEGNRYIGKAILLAPWKRTRHGERPRMRAVVVGWRTSRG